MFNKLKQFKDLRDQAKTLQNALAKESITLDKNGVKLTMNGNMEVTNIEITETLANDKMASTMKDLMNDSVKKMQRIMAEKMQSMGGFPGLGM